MKQINNVKEKTMIIARQLIIKQTEPTDKNIVSVWCDLFPTDNHRLNDTELFVLIRKYVNHNGIKSCDKKLEKIRRKGERCLKEKGKYVGYGAKLIKQPKTALATYNIFTKGKKYSGNYNSLCRRIGRFSKVQGGK
jgi:ATP-dependent Lon protease